jgi:hypothetical protein
VIQKTGKEHENMNEKLVQIFWLMICTAMRLCAQQGSSDISAEDLRAHVKYLASDELEGRLAGTEGNAKAAKYIAGLFAQYGLTPAGDNGTYFQSFDFVSAVKLGAENSLAFEGNAIPDDLRNLRINDHFRPLGFSSNASVSGPLVFAGYGITAPEMNYDDYASISAKGKVVVVLRYTPEGSGPHSKFYRHSALREKARMARENGATALIIVTGPADEQDDELMKLTYDHSFATSGIAALTVKRSVLEMLLKTTHTQLKSIQDSIKSARRPVAFEFTGVGVKLQTEIVKVAAQTANVAGYVGGNDPARRDQVLILGAHMDHLGYGGPGSGSLQPDAHEVHNGADDNASGTSALLELAQAFAARKTELKRTVMFLSFSGEELGALGSTYYVNHPLAPLAKSVAMLNMDMIGRLDNNTLIVGGTGTSPEWNPLLKKYNTDSTFTFKLDPSGFGPSDHAQFYGKNIPVLFFWTGDHSDYHKPSDDWDKLNYAGEEKIVRFVYNITLELDEQEAPPVFARVESPGPSMGAGDTRGFSVTLGIIPNYGQSVEGMKINSIRPNGPAEKAGLKPDDVIVGMAGKKVLNIYDYMGILGELRPGDEVEVEVIRGSTRVKVTARMDKRK